MTSYGPIKRVKRGREPVKAFQALELEVQDKLGSSEYAKMLGTEVLPALKKKKGVAGEKEKADVAAVYALSLDKVLAATDPSAQVVEDDSRLPTHTKNGPRDQSPDSTDPWPQIKYFITEKRDAKWISVFELVTKSPKNFSEREKRLRVQATHIDFTSKKEIFLHIFCEFDVKEDLNEVLRTTERVIAREEVASARGIRPIHKNVSPDIQHICVAMMRGTFFRNKGSIVFQKTVFHEHYDEEKE